MKACIVLGNTRERSNTEALAGIFSEELAAKGVEVKTFSLRQKNIRSCIGCEKCHSVLDSFGCVLKDDMDEIATEILASDLLVLSSPIYSWFATPPIKALMDRLYAFTKFTEPGNMVNLMKKQRFALIATSGDECSANCDLLDQAINRMAQFAGLPYLGYFAAQDKGYENNARQDTADGVRAFAEKCAENLK